MRKCTKCQNEYPYTAEYFNRNKSSSTGLDIYCKPCRREIAKGFYVLNREKEIKRCSTWNKLNAKRVASNMAKCRAKNPEHFRQSFINWRNKNKDKVRSYNKQKCHKRRAAVRNTECKATSKDIFNLIKSANGTCSYCGNQASLTLDHIRPLSRGGSHSLDNLVAACLPCNMAKGTKHVDEFLLTLRRE